MKKFTSILLVFSFALASLAQAELKVVTVDMQRLFKEYYKTEQALEKLRDAAAQAEETRQNMVTVGQALVAEVRELEEKAQNPALSEEARQAAAATVDEKTNEVLQKQQELRTFEENTRRSLMQRNQTHRELMLDEITAQVMLVGKEKGADLIFDTSAPENGVGLIPSVLYAKEEWDVTDSVLTRLNKDAPAK